ncbi:MULTISPECIES: formyltransferase family protein [Pseudoalteromonas]|uniref:Uncharacterized protein n=1 Tax=Pseudoalteromonas porphyrae TaxID=187330 RepID=A0A0N1EA80_9GAMM|nr:formyltransferase family protein [Pseudoalteromonas porphyrae]KPH56704.1 hypothetical protein ADS77_20680 [Pseudoalteromonas porphyrae]
MQKFAVFTGSCQSLPVVQYLLQTNQLACVVLVDGQPNPDLMQLQQWLKQQNITTLPYSKNGDDALLSQLDRLAVNCGVVYLFRHKIRKSLMQYFNGELMNIHPSPLPEYRGPQPLYWQLRNGETLTKLTMHQVTQELDCGDIACDVEIDIHPFDTIQCLYQKTSQALLHLISQYCELKQNNQLALCKQTTEYTKLAPALQPSDLVVNWSTCNTSDIVNMAKAGNLDRFCAQLIFRQSTFQLLQASKVECALKGITPGTIIELGLKSGLIVKTHDGAVKLDILGATQGCFDGYRFALLFGLEPGLVFDNDVAVNSR